MKKMPKELFDEVIEISRNYWECGDTQLLKYRTAIAFDIERITGVNWICVHDLVDSIVQFRAFFPDAENEVIYNVLNVLGWEVTDCEIQESESL